MMDNSNSKEFYVNRKRNRKLKRFAMLGLVLLLIIINLIVVPKITGEHVKYEDISYLMMNDNRISRDSSIFRYAMFGFVSVICFLILWLIRNRNYQNYEFSLENSQLFD